MLSIYTVRSKYTVSMAVADGSRTKLSERKARKMRQMKLRLQPLFANVEKAPTRRKDYPLSDIEKTCCFTKRIISLYIYIYKNKYTIYT